MDEKDLTKYEQQLCRILVEKRRKHQNTYTCVFGKVEIVNDRRVYVTDCKNKWFKIPIESIRGICVNEEQW